MGTSAAPSEQTLAEIVDPTAEAPAPDGVVAGPSALGPAEADIVNRAVRAYVALWRALQPIRSLSVNGVDWATTEEVILGFGTCPRVNIIADGVGAFLGNMRYGSGCTTAVAPMVVSGEVVFLGTALGLTIESINYVISGVPTFFTSSVVATGSWPGPLRYQGSLTAELGAAVSTTGSMQLVVNPDRTLMFGSNDTEITDPSGTLDEVCAVVTYDPLLYGNYVPFTGYALVPNATPGLIEIYFQTDSPTTGRVVVRVAGGPDTDHVIPNITVP